MQNLRLHNLGSYKRVWVIGAVRGRANALNTVSKKILNKQKLLDRLVFTGNIVGPSSKGENFSLKSVDVALLLRSTFISNYSSDVNDVVFLRGQFEELLDKSRQLHISPNPKELVEWMYSRGLDSILSAYGISSGLLKNAAKDGALALSRTSVRIHEALVKQSGHYKYISTLKRLAYNDDRSVLVVSAGLAKDRPLEAQSDELWWGGGFSNLDEPYGKTRRFIRGLDPEGKGLASGKYGITLDSGDKGVFAALFSSDGNLLETIQG